MRSGIQFYDGVAWQAIRQQNRQFDNKAASFHREYAQYDQPTILDDTAGVVVVIVYGYITISRQSGATFFVPKFAKFSTFTAFQQRL